ncbi:MAG: hypothetical protein KJ760_20035 [Proteobacteria bacterium]|nr:hypothetical protein [Pseudomonadota bacterium]
MNMKKIVGLLAAFALSWASAAYAVDNATEFGIEDDLTVLGTGGSATDPDVEIKGFSVFGVTQAAPALNIPAAPGNIFVNGYVQVSSGMYVTGSSTFTAGLYSTGISSFGVPGSIYISGGGTGEVLKKLAGGGMEWGLPSTPMGTLNRLQLVRPAGTLADSLFLQNAGDTSITMITGSSMTILGDGTDGLGVSGAAKLNGAVSILGANTFTVGTGLTSLGGALNVTGVSSLTGALTVNNEAQFGSGVTKSTFTTAGALNLATDADIVLTGANAQVTLPNAPVVGADAANKTYVDSLAAGAGPWDKSGLNVFLDVITDNVGVGVASPLAKLHVSSNNPTASDYLFRVSSGPLAGNDRFAIQADGAALLSGTLTATGLVTAQNGLSVTGGNAAITNNLTVNGNAQLGDAAADIHGINTAPVAGTALKVEGVDASGSYAAEFYSGANRVAWFKKK